MYPQNTYAAERFALVIEAMSRVPGVSLPGQDDRSGRKFGANALKVDGKIFAMLVDDELVVKLPAQRVARLIESGEGSPYTAGKSKPMREWLTVHPASRVDWVAISEEAFEYVGRVVGGTND
jgi:TfoX N-terminal domain